MDNSIEASQKIKNRTAILSLQMRQLDVNVNFPDGVLEGNAIFVRGRVINDVDELKNAKVLCLPNTCFTIRF